MGIDKIKLKNEGDAFSVALLKGYPTNNCLMLARTIMASPNQDIYVGMLGHGPIFACTREDEHLVFAHD